MEVKLGLIQMKVTPNKEANLNYAVNAIEVASRYGADIAVLPEMFCCPYSNRYLQTTLSLLAAAFGKPYRVLPDAMQYTLSLEAFRKRAKTRYIIPRSF